KPQIALEQVRAALLAGVSPGVVLMDASYGSNSGLREAITGFGLSYVAAGVSTVKVRPVRKGEPKRRRLSVEALAFKPPHRARRPSTWREGTNKSLQSRFARVRVRVAPQKGEARFAEETLLIEWPKGEAAPTKFWLATVDRNMSFRGLVDLVKLRWRIERDYHDLKQEIGLGHYEGRGWRGFHHHGTLSIAAYGFLMFATRRSADYRLWADAVEKVRGIRLERNNRIIGADFLNRTCAFGPHFESILLGDPAKIFFRQHR